MGNAGEAEEIAQESFVKALQALPRFSGERRFYPWLTVIASRLCIDHHRRRQRVEPSDEVDLGSVDDGHDARFALQADLANLDRAMRRLWPRHVEVLDLRERQGLSYDDIAGELGVPHATVETLLFRTRQALRREFRLVSAERLAAVPGVGWALGRGSRLRDRLARCRPSSRRSAAHWPPAPSPRPWWRCPGPHLPARPPPATSPVAPSGGRAPADTTQLPAPAPAVTPRIRPTTGSHARDAAATMPIQLDAEGSGLGADLSPIIDRLQTTLSGGTDP